MNTFEAVKLTRENYLATLKQAKSLTDLNTLGIERKAFIKQALEQAIEKETPIRPLKSFHQFGNIKYSNYICPICKTICMEAYNYCRICSQALDWSDAV